MKISQFTVKELDEIRQAANFTDLEMSCFNLKAKNKTNYQLAMELNICDSTVSTTMKSVRAKITAVLEQRASDKVKTAKKHKDNLETLNPLVMPSDAANNSNNTTTATVIIERIRPVTAIPFPAGPC